MKRLEVEIGQTFGRWTVIGLLPPKNWKSMCLCQCSCEKHTVKEIPITNLVNGYTKSCGCLSSEVISMRNKLNSVPTKFIEKDDYYIGITRKGEEFIFDKDDYELVSKYTWYTEKKGYFIAWVVERKKHVFLHRLVLGDIPDGYVVDHINRDRADNRKCNLRICTNSENILNAGLSKANKSGYKGVSWDKRSGKWVVNITINRKHIYIGSFKDIDDVVRARDKYALDHGFLY